MSLNLLVHCHPTREPISNGSMTAWWRYQLYEGLPCSLLCLLCPMSLPCYVSIQCLLYLSCVRCLSSTSCLFERSHSAGEPISSGSMTAWLRYRLYEGVPCPLLCLNLMSLRCLTSPMSLKLSSVHVLLISHYYHLARASNLKLFLFQR